MTAPVDPQAPAVFLMGPTASGKTRAAIELVSRLDLDIISVDSAMVYRGLDIGTGKPLAEELALAPHRLIDIRNPDEAYSAAEFRADALREMASVRRAARVPLLVGGTGLYFRALRRGLSPLPSAHPPTRARLAAQARARGWPALHARLRALDPASAARIHRNDPQRIQRALEVIELTGRPMSELLSQREGAVGPAPHVVVLERGDRARLHADIARRFRDMLARGLVGEVEQLRSRWALGADAPAMRAVGYRQVSAFLDGELDHDAMVEQGVAATRQLARRQLTWLRSEGQAMRFDSQDPRLIERLASHVAAVLGA